MNSRRLMSDVRLPPALVPPVGLRHALNLPQKGRQVLWLDLNCSESRCCRPFLCCHPMIAHHSLHCGMSSRPMSALGQTRPCGHADAMSGLPESGHWLGDLRVLRFRQEWIATRGCSYATARKDRRSNSPNYSDMLAACLAIANKKLPSCGPKSMPCATRSCRPSTRRSTNSSKPSSAISANTSTVSTQNIECCWLESMNAWNDFLRV